MKLNPSPSTRLPTSKECAQRVFHEHLNFIALFAFHLRISKFQARAELKQIALDPFFVSEFGNKTRIHIEVAFPSFVE